MISFFFCTINYFYSSSLTLNVCLFKLETYFDSFLPDSAHMDDSPKQVMAQMVLDDPIITSEKQKKKLEKELKSKQKEIAKQEKKEKEREERENKAKAKEEKKKEKLEKKSAARSNMKANSVQGQPCMEDFR